VSEKPKVRREWTGPRGGTVATLLFDSPEIDTAAGVFDLGDRYHWVTLNHIDHQERARSVMDGYARGFSDAKAAAEDALRAAGYVIEEPTQ